MAMCEKCWGDAYLRHMSDPSKGQAEHYHDLLEERKDNPCVELPEVVHSETEPKEFTKSELREAIKKAFMMSRSQGDGFYTFKDEEEYLNSINL